MLLQRGDVAPTGSARRRAPPSAEPASCATCCAGKQRLRAPVPDADGGSGIRRFLLQPQTSPVKSAGKGSGLRLKRSERAARMWSLWLPRWRWGIRGCSTEQPGHSAPLVRRMWLIEEQIFEGLFFCQIIRMSWRKSHNLCGHRNIFTARIWMNEKYE